MAYSHITREQRFKIQSWLEIDMSQSEIAENLEVNKSSISLEIRKNSSPDGVYRAVTADRLSRERRKQGRRSTKKLLNDTELRKVVITRIKTKDSPEQVSGRRQRKGKSFVSHETIYQFIYTERRDLLVYLRQQKGKYRRRHGTKSREKAREMSKKAWITDRPDSINNRTEIGHWEGDTIRAKERTMAIATHVERLSGYAVATKLEYVTAKNMHTATVQAFSLIPKHKRLSETNDNGMEFSDWETTAKQLDMKHYFALPYHSWERGTNENWNGLLRQFFPKGSSFATVKQKDVDKAVRNLNHRPRKRLNYLTPYEVFVKGMKP